MSARVNILKLMRCHLVVRTGDADESAQEGARAKEKAPPRAVRGENERGGHCQATHGSSHLRPDRLAEHGQSVLFFAAVGGRGCVWEKRVFFYLLKSYYSRQEGLQKIVYGAKRR